MTNSDYIQTLDTEGFEKAIRMIYFASILDKMGTPTPVRVIDWLNQPYDPTSEFWERFRIQRT
jgi:hypothetical protein